MTDTPKSPSFLSRFVFRDPKKAEIVVFDAEENEVLTKTCLTGLDYCVLPARGERYYVSFGILVRSLKNFRIMDLIQTKNLKQCLGNWYCRCIELIQPKIVITYIDTQFFFQWVSRNYPDAVFLTVQNGRRNRQILWDFVPELNGKKVHYYFSHFFCFGQSEVAEYKKYGHVIDHFYKVGSIKGGYYRAQADLMRKPADYDICLISQFRDSIMDGTDFPEIKHGLITLFEFLKQFIQKNPSRVCIALCSGSERETGFYRTFFGSEVHLIEQKPDSFFSSYEAIDASNVTITLDSTLGLEALGFGKKVLFCNFTKDDAYDIDMMDICRTNSIDYSLFENKLNTLLSIPECEYLEQIKESRPYLMDYDPVSPAHVQIRKFIDRCLES